MYQLSEDHLQAGLESDMLQPQLAEVTRGPQHRSHGPGGWVFLNEMTDPGIDEMISDTLIPGLDL